MRSRLTSDLGEAGGAARKSLPSSVIKARVRNPTTAVRTRLAVSRAAGQCKSCRCQHSIRCAVPNAVIQAGLSGRARHKANGGLQTWCHRASSTEKLIRHCCADIAATGLRTAKLRAGERRCRADKGMLSPLSGRTDDPQRAKGQYLASKPLGVMRIFRQGEIFAPNTRCPWIRQLGARNLFLGLRFPLKPFCQYSSDHFLARWNIALASAFTVNLFKHIIR